MRLWLASPPLADSDDRPIVGDYDFDGLSAVVSPLWQEIDSTPFHPVYYVDEAGRQVYDKVVQMVVTRARQEGIDDSFSRRRPSTPINMAWPTMC